MKHNRFDEAHRKVCDECRDQYEDFCQDTEDDARLDALSEIEESEGL